MKNAIFKGAAFALSAVFSAVSLLGAVAATPAKAPAKGVVLPKVGQTIEGFTVKKIEPIAIMNGNAVTFAHDKTGIDLIWLANDDKNRAFDMTFRSYPVSDNGANHVLEHSILASSNKYPGKDLFFSLTQQTYNTFMNAMTYPTLLIYPVSSGDDGQLLALEDAYLSMLFDASLTTNEDFLAREGWRYELESLDAPLTINGVVLNEMTQNYSSIVTAAYSNAARDLLPDTSSRFQSGGVPESIPNLTQEELVKIYKNVYTPRNSAVMLYGDIELQKHLNQIDEYLVKFDNKQPRLKKEAAQKPFTAPVKNTYYVPAEKGADTTKKAAIISSYAFGELSDLELCAMNVLGRYFSNTALPINKALNQSGIATSNEVAFETNYVQPLMAFFAFDADEKQADKLQEIITEQLRAIVKNGLDEEVLRADIAQQKMNSLLIRESATAGVETLVQMSYDYNTEGDALASLNRLKIYEQLEERIGTSYFEDLIDKYLLKNNHRALTITVPKAGLKEENAARQAKELQAKKDSMTKSEKEALVKKTAEFKKYLSSNNAEEAKSVDKLSVTKPADLPPKVDRYDIKESTTGGIRYISTALPVTDLTATSVYLDLGNFKTLDEVFDLQSILLLMGEVKANGKDPLTLTNEAKKYVNGLSITIGYLTTDHRDGSGKPVLSISFKALEENYDKAVKLLSDMLYKSDFASGAKRLQELADQIITVTSINMARGGSYALYDAMSGINDSYAWTNALNGVAGYDYFVKLKKELAKDPDATLKRLQATLGKLTSNGATALFAGNEQLIKGKQAQIAPIFAGMPKTAPAANSIKFAPSPRSHAIEVATDSNANVVAFDRSLVDPQKSGVMDVLSSAMSDRVLYPKVRFEGGAYSTGFSATRYAVAIYSGSDPNIDSTYAVFKSIPKAIGELKLTKKQLDNYIINAYGSVTPFRGIYSGAQSALTYYIAGLTFEQQDARLSQILSATEQQLKAYAPLFEKALANPYSTTLGPKSAIDAAKTTFEKTTNLESLTK